jgi:hypothetical protein
MGIVIVNIVRRANKLWARLMSDTLVYPKFGAHGGDWGTTVTEPLARSHPDFVLAIHLTDVPPWAPPNGKLF